MPRVSACRSQATGCRDPARPLQCPRQQRLGAGFHLQQSKWVHSMAEQPREEPVTCIVHREPVDQPSGRSRRGSIISDLPPSLPALSLARSERMQPPTSARSCQGVQRAAVCTLCDRVTIAWTGCAGYNAPGMRRLERPPTAHRASTIPTGAEVIRRVRCMLPESQALRRGASAAHSCGPTRAQGQRREGEHSCCMRKPS